MLAYCKVFSFVCLFIVGSYNNTSIQEKISYDMPAFVYKGKPLLNFAAQTKHIGLYALPEANIEFSNELK